MTGVNSTTSSTSGTTNPEIDAVSICRIIRECKRSGVLRLKMKDLEVEFVSDQLVETPKKEEPQTVEQIQYLDPEMLKAKMTPEDQEIFKDFNEIQLALDDPLAFEEAQMKGDLEQGSLSERAEDSGSEYDLYGSGGV
jgi:hypothetical protein